MNMKLKKLLNDIQKTEDKIAELQEHLKRQNTLRQQMEDIEIVKSFRSMKLDSRSLLVLLDGIQKGTVKGKQRRSSQTTCWSDDRKRGFRR